MTRTEKYQKIREEMGSHLTTKDYMFFILDCLESIDEKLNVLINETDCTIDDIGDIYDKERTRNI